MLQLWMCWGLSNFAEASLVRMVWPVRAVWEISATWVANRPRAQTWKSCCHCVDNLDWKLLRSQAEADAIYAAGMRFLQHHIQCFKISSRTKAENSRAKYLACCWTFECAGCNWSAGAWNPRSTCSTTCWSAPRSGDTSPNYYKLTTTSNQFKLVVLSAWSMHHFVLMWVGCWALQLRMELEILALFLWRGHDWLPQESVLHCQWPAHGEISVQDCLIEARLNIAFMIGLQEFHPFGHSGSGWVVQRKGLQGLFLVYASFQWLFWSFCPLFVAGSCVFCRTDVAKAWRRWRVEKNRGKTAWAPVKHKCK